MGWSSHGYVFTQQPHWDRLRELPGSFGGIWGYKHRSADIWLAAIPFKRERGRTPFTTNPPTDFTLDRRTVTPETRHLLALFDSVALKLDTQYLWFSSAWIKLTVAVASLTKVPTFFFTADDEFVDVGCRAEPRRLIEFAGKFPDFLTRCRSSGIYVFVLDPHHLDSFPATRLEGLLGTEGIEIIPGSGELAPPLPSATKRGRRTRTDPTPAPGDEDLSRWSVFYRFPVELWPPEAGDPAEILGLGTWDLFHNFERDLKQEFTCSGN